MANQENQRELYRTDDDILNAIRKEIAIAYSTEIASGVVNSSNKVFRASVSFYPESIEVFLAGDIQLKDTDYDVTSANEITFKAAPTSGRIVFRYIPYE